MKKYKKVILLVIVVFALGIIGTFKLGYFLGYNTMSKKLRQEQEREVESFFENQGYEISIIGAYTKGREHEGPFLYGWHWKSFEISEEVIMLYYYEEKKEINNYLAELDEWEKEKCYLSQHFVFYYGGNNKDIISAIENFCVLSYSI